MRWEELTDADFAQAARDTGLCIIALGVLERHGDHLPLGTDFINAHAVATLAAQREPAVVFPPFYLGQINEARHFPGAVAIPPRLLWDLLEAVCDEVGRNGFSKILLHNGHGGNTHWLQHFCQCALHKPKPYTLYMTQWVAKPAMKEQIRKVCPTTGGHGDEQETCLLLATAGQLVKTDRIPDQPGLPLGRLKHIRGAYTGIWWYAEYPEHYAGDARTANEEKAGKVLEIYVKALTDIIRAVKQDQEAPRLQREFFDRVDRVGRQGR